MPLIRARARGLSLTSTNWASPELLDAPGCVDQTVRVASERRVELDRDDELTGIESPLELGRLSCRLPRHLRAAVTGAWGGPSAPVVVDGGSDRRDLCRRGPTAPSDQLRPERARPGREVGEVLGRRVRERDPRARDGREPDVRERGEDRSVARHLGERVQRGRRPTPVIRAERGDVELAQACARSLRRDAGQRHGVAVEAHQRDDRQARDRANRLDRELQLGQVVERLEQHEVGAAALQDPRLLRERLAAVGAVRADRAADEHLAAGDLARIPGELDAGRIDRLEVVREEVLRELVAVRPERVRLDQFRPGIDEADVHRHDGVRGAKVGLLGAAQAGNRGREHDSHPAVGDDGRPAVEAVGEAPGHAEERNQVTRSTTKRGMDQTQGRR